MLHEIFEASADASPDAVVVICGREETTYGEPEAQANRMARHLRRCGVRRGARVGLLLPRSAGAYAALLGILKAGAAYVHTTGFLEWDLVEIDDDVALNEDCILQTHLFEDRVLKAARLRIGDGCELGACSVVLYDSEMEDGSRLDALSLLMKGERLPSGTAWVGSPASRHQARDNGSGLGRESPIAGVGGPLLQGDARKVG
ncbi:AMP-binding protein [Opitutus sp. GAS368]|uniref:AMP-binding protein n=1 Tax=Opitutus sp. GAS368 TaxID=1882749 RepID=UPI0012FE1E33|nr:AMP-binding protein [Opitutus sp. GAS368]